MALVGDEGLDKVTAGAIRNTKGGIEVQTRCIDTAIFHIAQYRLLQKIGRHILAELALAEIAGIKLLTNESDYKK